MTEPTRLKTKIPGDTMLRPGTLILFFVLVRPCTGFDLGLQGSIQDYSTGTGLSVGTLRVPPFGEAARSEDKFLFATTIDEKPDSVTLEVWPSEDFKPRTIRLRRRSKELDKIERNVKIFLVRRDIDTSYLPIDQAAKFVSEGDLDAKLRELALLEHAFSKLHNPTSQYGIKVRYNYAMSLLEHCKEGYDTCNQARTLCTNLVKNFEEKSVHFEEEKIGKSRLTDCKGIVADVLETQTEQDNLHVYNEITLLFKSGFKASPLGFLEAAEALSTYCDDFVDATFWQKNGRPRYAMCRDTAVSYLMYFDRARRSIESDKLEEVIRQSYYYFSLAQFYGDDSRTTGENLSLVSAKLRGLVSR